MPTPYVEKMAKEHHMTVPEAEKKWSEAKKAAENQGQGDNYAYITTIFRRFLKKTAQFHRGFHEEDHELATALLGTLQAQENQAPGGSRKTNLKARSAWVLGVSSSLETKLAEHLAHEVRMS